MTHADQRMRLYSDAAVRCGRAVTTTYSTSFSLSIRGLSKEIRSGIYGIYGFVRLADEIVDSFHGHDQRRMFDKFKDDTWVAIEHRISTNPILHAFQETYHAYGLEPQHVRQFLMSMEWDLDRALYDRVGYDTYIVGSAEVVGLMCLKVFLQGDLQGYERLRPAAVRLGAAFQKVNFLRDLREDYLTLGRTYFPDVDLQAFDEAAKQQIQEEIAEDLAAARAGITQLPKEARFGVLLAYTYYRRLLARIARVPSSRLMESRIRVPEAEKALLALAAFVRTKLGVS